MAQYVRYTEEQKQAALAKMGEIGVTKTSRELGIAVATLYKWKGKPSDAPATASKKKRTSPKAIEKAPVVANDAQPEITVPEVVTAEMIQTQLAEDDGLRDKVRALETENSQLREKIVSLKKMLQTVIDA